MPYPSLRAQSRGATPTILLAGFSKDELQTIDLLLSFLEVTLVSVSDAEQALKFLRETRPDLVVADAHLPLLDGLALCGRIKRVGRLKEVPVAIVSSSEDQALSAACAWVGADAHLLKPFGRAFREAVEGFLDLSSHAIFRSRVTAARQDSGLRP